MHDLSNDELQTTAPQSRNKKKVLPMSQTHELWRTHQMCIV